MRSEIKVVEDLGAPALVATVNIVTKEVVPAYNEMAHYIMTAVGYGSALLGFGGAFVKNIGVASLSGTVDHIYNRVRGGVTSRVPTRMAHRAVAGSVQRSYQPEFEATAPHAF
jgi:hypothetical protein